LQSVNQKLLSQLQLEQVEVAIELVLADEQAVVEESELDEMWSYVGKKTNPRWLWHAIDRKTGQVVAYVFGRRKDEVFLQLKTLLEPFGIKRYCTDGWGAYERHLPVELHQVGKQNTQRIERKHLSLRTRIKRLVRKTICFSKTELMHDKRDWTIYKSLRVRVINLIENNKSKTLPADKLGIGDCRHINPIPLAVQ
jgi:insertion element IS1 protein InsB